MSTKIINKVIEVIYCECHGLDAKAVAETSDLRMAETIVGVHLEWLAFWIKYFDLVHKNIIIGKQPSFHIINKARNELILIDTNMALVGHEGNCIVLTGQGRLDDTAAGLLIHVN